MADPLFAPTLRLVVSVASEILYKKNCLTKGFAVGEGHYYELEGVTCSEDEVKKLAKQVEELVASGDVITRVEKPWKEALEYFKEQELPCAMSVVKTRVSPTISCYECQGKLRLALEPVHERVSALKDGKYSLVPCGDGFVVSPTEKYEPQPALLGSFQDHAAFAKSQGMKGAGDLNSLAGNGRARQDYVLHCELRQEAKLAAIATRVLERKESGKPVKVVCIAGPTSSGKTTFATKLCMYLQNAGFVAKPLTVDHYYLPLDRQPKYQARKDRADVDYDAMESMDVELVGEHINALVSGKPVMTPVYNMKTGYRDGDGVEFPALPPNGVLVIEGIHALNPMYTQAVDSSMLFKVFISPLTVMQLDDSHIVPSTNHRLLRRISRDYLFRAKGAALTLAGWDNVRAGERTWIFPHQNSADFVMNSASDYEIPVLKTLVEPLLRQVPVDDKCFDKAQELLKLLDCFGAWPSEIVPATALMREFIGNGAYDCH